MPMTTYYPGFAHDVFREELLEKARAAHPHGLLICSICGWSWLTMETAKINPSLEGNFPVGCRDEFDCFRRQQVKMAP